jgi:hypothetical protein
MLIDFRVLQKESFVVIPNKARNLSGFEIKKEGFLGTQRASE